MSAIHTRILPPYSLDESELIYVVIAAREQGKWVFVRHRERSTWELPAGHIEKGETAEEAARRELAEETGTLRSTLKYLCDYQVILENKIESGRLYIAEIQERNRILEYEIVELMHDKGLPAALTYPEVQTRLFRQAEALLRS